MTADRLEHAIAVVDSLPEIYRDTLRLKMIGYSDDEICDILDLKQDHGVQTASARLSHGAGKDGEER